MAGEPTHLAALIRWFLRESSDDIPARIHSRSTAEDGDPEWHGSFRAWLTAHPAAVDREGHTISWFRHWLWVMAGGGYSGRLRADFLVRLAHNGGDWLAAIRCVQPLTDDGEVMMRDFATETLKQFWRLMQVEPRREDRRPKSEAQHAAEESV